MKKFVAVLMSFVLVMSVTLSTSADSISKGQTFEYSGEEIFKGFVFAQGDLGKELNQIFNQSMMKKLNTEESKKFANDMVERIKAENPSFFNDLQSATYAKDPAKIDTLLKEAGAIVENDIAAMQDSADTAGIGLNAQTETEWYYYYYYVAAAAAGIVLVLFAIDITPIAANNDTDREMAIRTLLEEVN